MPTIVKIKPGKNGAVIGEINTEFISLCMALQITWLAVFPKRPYKAPTITSGADSKHGVGSLHPAPFFRAWDIRIWEFKDDKTLMRRACHMLKYLLGKDWDIVLEFKKQHIHAECDPKG